MGADLYIMDLHEKQIEQWKPEFDRAVATRDSLAEDSAERQLTQERVLFCYDKMREQGYFRDSYNDSNLLWKFNLSWWEDIIPMLDAENILSVEQIEKLRVTLVERENIFDLKIAALPPQEQVYFREKYARMQSFLNQAIELNQPILASL